MPIIRTIRPNDNTVVGIWNITESIDDLSSQVVLSSKSKELLKNRKASIHKLQFLSIRAILLEFGYSDKDLSYINNTPILNNGKKISISHSNLFSCVIISDFKVGIDVQEFNNKINTIAKKFIGYEALYVKDNDIQIISIIWNIKESIYKIAEIIGLDYKNHLLVIPFNINDDFTYSWLIYKKRKERYISYFFTIENYSFAYLIHTCDE
tara:strand:- start:20134 stop:20760 length:627 start_codon:yes stop_codon:yes gene_type:complete